MPVIYALCQDPFMLPQALARPYVVPTTLQAVLAALVLGTSLEEQQVGLYVGFDSVEATEREQIAVTAEHSTNGLLTVDFLFDGGRWGPGILAGTSNQLFEFVDPLYATVFQFPQVAALDMTTMCWGELDCTGVLLRSDWEAMVAGNHGRDVGPGCGLRGAWFDPACGAELPECGGELNVNPVVEGGLGFAHYGLEFSAASPCFVNWTGTAVVKTADGAEPAVAGSPIDLRIRGLADFQGFSTLDGSQPAWSMSNWCGGEAVLSVELEDVSFEWPAGGRCDAPGDAASLSWSGPDHDVESP